VVTLHTCGHLGGVAVSKLAVTLPSWYSFEGKYKMHVQGASA